jgi:predicted amidohydrolase
MQIGFAQIEPALGDLDETLKRIDVLAPSFAGADLIVLPELCNSGYNFENLRAARAAADPIDDSPFLRHLASVAERYDLHIVTGLNERDGERLFNTAVLLGPAGVIGHYRKMHLFWNEPDFFTPGDTGFPVFELPGGVRIGMLICFDWVFPEAFRALAVQGAEIICHPSNLVIPGKCQSAIPTHALCNGVYIITANRIGTEGELTFTGGSIIAGPRGDVIAEASPDRDEVVIRDVDLELARDKMITPRNNLIDDRRPDQYGLLCE